MQSTWRPECVSVMRWRPGRDGPHLPAYPTPPPQLGWAGVLPPPCRVKDRQSVWRVSVSIKCDAPSEGVSNTKQDICGISAEVSVPASTSPPCTFFSAKTTAIIGPVRPKHIKRSNQMSATWLEAAQTCSSSTVWARSQHKESTVAPKFQRNIKHLRFTTLKKIWKTKFYIFHLWL